MKINRLKFEEKRTQHVGLKEIDLQKLGSVVALIGKNGSGKTRILNFIEQNFSPTIYDLINNNCSSFPKSIQDAITNLQPFKSFFQKHDEYQRVRQLLRKNRSDVDLKNKIEHLSSEIKNIEKLYFELHRISLEDKMKLDIDKLQVFLSKIKTDYVKRVDYSQIRQLQDSISENDEEADSFENLIENVTGSVDYNEFGVIYKSSLRFLKKLPNQLAFDWIDCFGDVKKFEKRVSYKRYIALKDIFDKIFGKTLEWEAKNIRKSITNNGVETLHSGLWKINSREFNYSEFSSGEKTLFAYVLLFFLMSQNNNIRLKESIIIIDEPELHLHADAEIDLISGIREIIEDKGQLWIATHSINILSHLNIEDVFMVKNGLINHPTKTIQREALAELLRIEERVTKLSEFLVSISDWTYVQFMIECFTNPEVIETSSGSDSQVRSLKELINLAIDSKKKILLDFGAGKGRLYEHLVEDSKINSLIDYSALEPDTNLHINLVDKGVTQIFSNYDELENNAFDFIVLCNVLHEIPIEEWLPTINKIIEALSSEGNLIIIEAKTLTKGEQIGNTGFLLLSIDEIQTLFNLSKSPLSLSHKDDFQNITCAMIPKADLKTISIRNLLDTIVKLHTDSLFKIEHLRKTKNNISNSNKYGRQVAFLSQQYINAKLAYEFLKQNDNQ